METVIQKIKELRKEKGFSNENLAYELGISLSAYNKLERNETKLTVERLYQLSKILKEPVEKILDIATKNNFEQQNSDTSTGYMQQIEQIVNYYADNKELVIKLVENYKDTIAHLQEEVAFLRTKVK